MKLRNRLYLVYGISSALLVIVFLLGGLYVIDRIISADSHSAMELKLEHIIFYINDRQSILDHTGLASLPAYQKSLRNEILQQYRDFKWGKTGTLCITPAPGESYFLGANPFLDIKSDADGQMKFFDPARPSRPMYTVSKKAANGWTVTICQSTNELYAQFIHYLHVGGLTSLAILILTFFAITLFTSKFSKQIERMLFTMRRVSAGDLEIRMNYPSAFDEDKELQNGINAMIGNLKMREIERDDAQTEARRSQKIESIGILAGGIAHDFNNLLTAIRGNLQLAGMLNNNPDTKACLSDCEKATDRAVTLTRQLLTFSKGGAPYRTSNSISELLQNNALFLLRGSKTKCEFHFMPDLKCALIDVGQIGQAIDNIIINANQAMPNGGLIRIYAENFHVKADRVGVPLEHGEYIRIDIADEGPGISPDNMEKIFDPFFTTKPSGSGLGLSTSHNIIRQHNGCITVKSLKGKGTTFSIFLPAAQEGDLPVNATLQKREQLSYVSGGKVLIMDDQNDIRSLLGKMFAIMNCQCEFAANGKDAFELYKKAKLENEPFDIVFMDLTIPGGMGGKEAIRKLKKFDPDVIAVVASGYSNDPVMANYIQYGFADRLDKPFRIMDISRIMEERLGKRSRLVQ